MSLGESREQIVAAELSHLLESPTFRNSKRCRDFLEYIVQHTMTGPSGTLKERSIGVELFQLPPDFDTGQHTIVRVTANEVRKKLAQHYQAENGSYHPVRIDLPPGSYSAAFRWETPAVEAPVAEAQAAVAPAWEAQAAEPPTAEPPAAEPQAAEPHAAGTPPVETHLPAFLERFLRLASKFDVQTSYGVAMTIDQFSQNGVHCLSHLDQGLPHNRIRDVRRWRQELSCCSI